MKRDGATLLFDFGSFSSRMTTKKNEEGTVSFMMADPGVTNLGFLARPAGNHYALMIRDAQHEYTYTPAR